MDYTHLALPTFSKSYLQRHGILRDDIYRKLYIDLSKLTEKERSAIVKRVNPKTWQRIPDKLVPSMNAEFFKNSNIVKKGAEITPKLPEVKTPLPDENEAGYKIIEDIGNSTETQNGSKPYLKG